MNLTCRVRYHIEGMVQGVGFRPFVYTLALRFGLKGFVLNNALGVEIELEGDENSLECFDKALHTSLPPLARMDVCDKSFLTPLDDTTFEIRHSEEGEIKSSFVPPDMAMCHECECELHEAHDRRYDYFFINCTNCGPRYSIIKTVPYDRPNTSMHPFIMCDACQAEYTNPLDRRYHAQPISCPNCGPTLTLKNMNDDVIAHNHDAIKQLADLIQKGHIVAMKGMGGFHLMCDATNDTTLAALRERKRRPTKPFAVMFKDIASLEDVCVLSEGEKEGVTSLLRPIVLVKRSKSPRLFLGALVAPMIDRLGVFLPYTPLHVKLFHFLRYPIVATSANRSGEPIISDAKSLREKLGDVVEYYLDYNREIINSSDDSVVQYLGKEPLLMRLSRGLAPLSFRIKTDEKRSILAVGAHQKNAIAIYLNHQMIVSPYIGDLDNIATNVLFEAMIERFKSFYDFVPELIVGDLHPNYVSTQWAKKQKLPFMQVQHHYAHILSAMCEHRLDEKVLGVAWDGTGYGVDGTIWGGEFLVCDTHGFERVASFEPFLLLGGDASIKESRRVLASILWDVNADDSLLAYFTPQELKSLKQLYTKKLNAPRCSSVGRLFDAVAVICGMHGRVSYDGESGLYVESLYDEAIHEAYHFTCKEGVIHYKEAFLEMLYDKEPRVIASKFINALVHLIDDIATQYSYKVVLSGGVFQNRTLVEKILELKNHIFVSQHQLPPNDGGVCVGQLYYALQNNT